MDSHTISMLTIPLFTGAIGYLTNLSGVWMLFYPIRFHGFRLPGLAALAQVLPRKIQQIPGVMRGGVGWQGIIPSRAAKMGSIAVDKGIGKLGGASEFYKELEPDRIAEHILATSRDDIRAAVERIMEREQGGLWRDVPPRVREAVHARVEKQLPDIVRTVTEEIGKHADQLLDVKLMTIRRIEENPELSNRIFLEVGRRELKLMVNFGFIFGFLQGIPLVFVVELLPYWWVLPIGGVIIGYVTNWLGLWMIFEPIEPRKIGPFKLHGLFLRRQEEVAEVYAGIIADDIVTLENIGDELLKGPRSDRTRQMIETAMRPAVDRAAGPARLAVRAALGPRQYESLRDSVATETVEYAIGPLTDPEFCTRTEQRASRPVRETDSAALLQRLLGDAALGDARGRVAAAPPRRRAGVRRRPAPPRYLRRLMEDERPSEERPGEERTSGSVLRATPALAKLTVVAWWRAASWAAETWVRAGSRMVRAAASGDNPADLLREAQSEARDQARRILGIEGEDTAISDAVKERFVPGSGSGSNGAGDDEHLRERGAELLRRSADVHFEEDAHPAYTRILEDLAPDEARILRMLAIEGPQPSVDVRAGLVPLKLTSELVGTGLNMIGAEAGCRHLDDVPAYLNNLFRLGLTWFSSEALSDPLRYQVLEAQPDVAEAMRKAGRAHTIRRSIHLTPFGEDFVSKCLPLDDAPDLEAVGQKEELEPADDDGTDESGGDEDRIEPGRQE